ncbi:hypothetical protein BDN72DRAFT_838231 [Pluteus cervinus]|uniref:Uncharacterized protein n=1 Tax=Pluteus cervinus TaxID=181527 RepID=A0ACD3AYZ0_9AGAR|nr:hypothetical protein BDN72DRAFT_838231 [Pluteus cervinus]
MAQDLPTELWLNILSCLPRGSVRKLLGVNRTLFELAMDDIYEEVRFIADDKEIRKTFDQLRNPTIARRVRQLYIQPSFFPLPERRPPDSRFHLVNYLEDQINSWLPQSHALPGTTGVGSTWSDPCRSLLSQATEAFSACSELRELTIVLRDHPIPPSFRTFLSAIWKTHATRLRRLDLDLTPLVLPFVIKLLTPPLSSDVEARTNVEQFNFILALPTYDFSAHRFPSYPPYHLPITRLLNRHKSTLRSLSITSPSECESTDFTSFFIALTQTNGQLQVGPRFPLLSHFHLHFPLHTSKTLMDPTHLNIFIYQHRLTLKSISLSPRTPFTSRRGTVSGLRSSWNYISFNTFSYANWVVNSFLKIKFPALEKLDLCYDPGMVPEDTFDGSVKALNKLWLSRLGAVNLREVVLTGLTLELPRKLAVLRDLAGGGPGDDSGAPTTATVEEGRGGVGTTLKRLTLGLNILQPEILDLIVKRFTALERLDLEYRGVAGTTSSREPSMRIRHRQEHTIGHFTTANFISDMKERTYLNSTLKVLRCALLIKESCGQYHPHESVAEAVCQAFTEMPKVDSYDANVCCLR